jgi:hypothetical protein
MAKRERLDHSTRGAKNNTHLNAGYYFWLGGLDSNQDKRLQRPLSYRWTTPEYDLRFAIFNLRFKIAKNIYHKTLFNRNIKLGIRQLAKKGKKW